MLEIARVLSIEEDYEIRCWKVISHQGPRRFQTRLDDWPFEVPGGGLLIMDVSGDLFYIRDPAALDAKSLKLLWSLLD